jgi:predicted MFS family arabinose efflux permease
MGHTGQSWCGYPYHSRNGESHNLRMPSPIAGGPSGEDSHPGGPPPGNLRRPPPRLGRYLLAGVAFLALADTAIVALALPPILRELDTDVAGVAAVLGVYAVVLAVALLPAERLGRTHGIRTLGLAGVALFGLGSLACGLADSLEPLLIARAVQALGGAALLVTAHAVLVGEPAATEDRAGWTQTPSGGTRQPHGLRLWRLAALLGTAAGPAIGGALTQALGWRSIFLVQAPAALAAVPACLSAPGARAAPGVVSRERDRTGGRALAFAALALISGAIAAALFLTVLLLISGWGIEPLAAALVVSVMPLSALAATRIGGPAGQRAATGAVLVAAGAAALAFLPNASVAWTILPQVAAGVGMGLSLAALPGELLPDRDGHASARLLMVRHAGIALALLILAPIAQHELDTTLEDTRLRGAALILDARIDPQLKLEIAPRLSGSVETEDPRGGLEEVFADARSDVDEDQLAAYDDLTASADDLLVTGVNEGFRTAFLVAAGLALLAAALLALALVPGASGWATGVAENATLSTHLARATRMPGIVAAASVVAVVAFTLFAESARPAPVEIADPCEDRDLPSTGGVTGFAQDAALLAADVIACRVGSSREELVLALADDDVARDYEERYGVNPRSALDIAGRFLPG